MKKTLDWNKYLDKAAEAVSEGVVLLKNENNALPLDPSEEIALFGRMQLHYYKSGMGSGGMVNVTKVTGILDGLLEAGARVNDELLGAYKKWDGENPVKDEESWGNAKWSQEEMPLDDALAEKIAGQTDTAVAVIARTAGEEMDNTCERGSYLLSEGEKQMLVTVRKHFKKLIVLLNTGNIIDMSEIMEISPDAVMYVWQGGMTGGTGTAQVLLGKSPSGKLPDTIAYSISDYPSDKYFGNKEKNFYSEDIYVGYRYFETFAPERVMFPFGFGLSYTDFEVNVTASKIDGAAAKFSVSVKNTGEYEGKEVVQLYYSAPCGKLGQPARQLAAFEKTDSLKPGEEQTLVLSVKINDLCSYDDSGVTGHRFCYVLEEGAYGFYIGTDSRSCEKAGEYVLDKLCVVHECTSAMAPVESFKRMKSDNGRLVFEDVPVMSYDENAVRKAAQPEELPYTGDKGIKLADVLSGKYPMDEFIAQLSDEDLAAMIRGEGMGSPKVTPGTAAAFGGVTERLKSFGIPCVCCDDGPSGMRLDCGTKAFSLPNGTLLAATFNTKLMTELFIYLGEEMAANKVDCLLGPGMNIHRHPLNGRNFEYFSEDPYLTGIIASAQLAGLKLSGVSGTIKHFCGNNQETCRRTADAIASERALREIYLKGFRTAVMNGADSVMTTYGSVNGLRTPVSYDLNTVILRGEWGFDGIVMTDWWAAVNRRDEETSLTDFAAMAAAGNDLYMVCADGEKQEGNTLEELKSGFITRGELQRNAADICRFVMNSMAMKRMLGTADEIELINRPDEGESNEGEVEFFKVDGKASVSGENIRTSKGGSHAFGVDVTTLGRYKVKITASSTASETAQLPVTVFCMGSSIGTFTWNGTGGAPVSFETDTFFFSRFITMRLYFAQGGLDIISLDFELIEPGSMQ
ncbi:MAG: glycoside hydrolase family 3 C-terminal domain-containing protein [Oscillospiraceae bacterium]